MIIMLYIIIYYYIIIQNCYNSSTKPVEAFLSPPILGVGFTFTEGSSKNNITTAR
jgi:hypothetical protein